MTKTCTGKHLVLGPTTNKNRTWIVLGSTSTPSMRTVGADLLVRLRGRTSCQSTRRNCRGQASIISFLNSDANDITIILSILIILYLFFLLHESKAFAVCCQINPPCSPTPLQPQGLIRDWNQFYWKWDWFPSIGKIHRISKQRGKKHSTHQHSKISWQLCSLKKTFNPLF